MEALKIEHLAGAAEEGSPAVAAVQEEEVGMETCAIGNVTTMNGDGQDQEDLVDQNHLMDEHQEEEQSLQHDQQHEELNHVPEQDEQQEPMETETEPEEVVGNVEQGETIESEGQQVSEEADKEVGTGEGVEGEGELMCEQQQIVSTDMNGQLEIEIPAGESREGAIHTIQLQSPGGNTHFVEGLVVTSAGGVDGSEEGQTTAIFHPATTGAFILPTSHSHNNNLASTTHHLVATSSTSPQTCEVITSDASEHQYLSGLQVVRVTSGDNGETIFLVPSSATGTGDKDHPIQQVMVLQSTGPEEMQEETVQVQQEVVEEQAVEINIPSPKPVLTTVKQEPGTNGDDGNNSNNGETITVAEAIKQHYQQQQEQQEPQQQNSGTTHLVVVTGNPPVTQAQTTSSPNNSEKTKKQSPPAKAADTKQIDVKPIVNTPSTEKSPTKSPASSRSPKTPKAAPVISNGPSIGESERPKRKAALKAAVTRKEALACASPRKAANRTPRKKPEPKTPVEVKGKGAAAATAATAVVINNTSAKVPAITSVTTVPTLVNKNISQSKTISTGLIGNTARTLFSFPPPPPIVTTPSRKASAAVNSFQKTAQNTNYLLLPEDLVSDSDEEADGNIPRKCVVCLRKSRFTEDIFEGPEMSNGGPHASTHPHHRHHHHPQLLPHMDVLIAHLNIPKTRGKSSELGICLSCLDSLQRWHIFNCAIVKRQEDAKTSLPGSFDSSPLNLEPFETRIYRNLKKMGKVKEVYKAATHSHFARRHLTERDWDFFCENLFRSSSARSERAKALERYLNCREKLSQLYCVKCQRMVRNGKKGFLKHMKTHHPHQPILFPCDICGSHLPEKGFGASNEDYYPHWISHFYFNSCEECGKRFPTKRSLGQHRLTVHKNKVQSKPHWSSRLESTPCMDTGPWKCDFCQATFKQKSALVAHQDLVHQDSKNHVCVQCGEAFKSASSLRGHVRRHEGRRDYKCEICNKEYYTYSALKGHKVVHQTARDFVCGICNKAFKKKKALEEHGTLHTGVKPHRCPICGREIRVKSNLYKHMKIHKKNAELGITSGRGRGSLGMSRTNNTPSTSVVVGGQNISQQQQTPHSSRASSSRTQTQTTVVPIVKGKIQAPKVKQIRVEDRILEIKQEHPQTMISHFQPSSAGLSNTAMVMNSTGNMTMSSSPMQGTTPIDVIVKNAELANGEHRTPIVVSIVADGLTTGPDGCLQMDPEQQAQLLSAVQSFAQSQGHNVTVAGGLHGGASGPTFITSHLPSSSTSNGTSVVSGSAGTSGGQDPILGVGTTHFYNAQQFFTSLDQLQN